LTKTAKERGYVFMLKKVSTETGYQGYLYESVEAGELYFVNGGSENFVARYKMQVLNEGSEKL